VAVATPGAGILTPAIRSNLFHYKRLNKEIHSLRSVKQSLQRPAQPLSDVVHDSRHHPSNSRRCPDPRLLLSSLISTWIWFGFLGRRPMPDTSHPILPCDTRPRRFLSALEIWPPLIPLFIAECIQQSTFSAELLYFFSQLIHFASVDIRRAAVISLTTVIWIDTLLKFTLIKSFLMTR
jgi:hypothetical protein